MKRPAHAAVLLLATCLGPAGCVIVQGSYDSRARQECQDIPEVDERLACERRVDDAKRQRHQEEVREN